MAVLLGVWLLLTVVGLVTVVSACFAREVATRRRNLRLSFLDSGRYETSSMSSVCFGHGAVMTCQHADVRFHQKQQKQQKQQKHQNCIGLGKRVLSIPFSPHMSKRLVLAGSAGSTTNEKSPGPRIPHTHPLAAHTFAGMVENGILERFGMEGTKRVIESWRLLDQDYIHDEKGIHNSSNPYMHQYCHSYVPGLSIRPFWDEVPSWCSKLQTKHSFIRNEFDRVTADLGQLQRSGNNVWAGALTADAGSYGEGWKTLVLMDRGMWDPINVNLFPITSTIVRDLAIPCTEVFFASMEPNSSIKMHTDFTNFVLTCHLGLRIPESGHNKCRLTVGDTVRQWRDGEVMLFDTSLMHDAVNESPTETRYILMLRVWHPDLTPIEQQALQFTYNCLEHPGLISTNPTERALAEAAVQQKMKFPLLNTGKRSTASGTGTGFGSGGANHNDVGGKSRKTNTRKKKKS